MPLTAALGNLHIGHNKLFDVEKSAS